MDSLIIDNLKSYKETIIDLCQILEFDVLFFITDREKILWKVNSNNFDIPQLTLGLPLKSNEAPARCIKTAKSVIKTESPQIYGINIKMLAIPISDGKQIIGSLITTIPLVNRTKDAFQVIAPINVESIPNGVPPKMGNELNEISDQLMNNLDDITQTIAQFTAMANLIKDREIVLNSKLEEINRLTKEMNEVMGLLKQVADETKLIGLNSTIEAIVQGSGDFGEVYRNIKKLLAESKAIFKNITRLSEQMKRIINETELECHRKIIANQEQDKNIEKIRTGIIQIRKIAQKN